MTLDPRDAALKAALTDAQALALTIIGEAALELVEGQIAIGCVIRNRVLQPKRFDPTFKEVCLRRWQFSCWIPEGGQANYSRLLHRTAACLAGTTPWPAQACWIAEGIITGTLADRTGGATHYYASWMPTPPKWAVGQTPSAVIGVHRFYSGIA